jgi:hypothetical protein
MKNRIAKTRREDRLEQLLERAIGVFVRELSAVQQASIELQALRWQLEDYRRAEVEKRRRPRRSRS